MKKQTFIFLLLLIVTCLQLTSTFANERTTDVTNVALEQPVVASSNYSSSYLSTNAVDGLADTVWGCATEDTSPYFYVDLGATYDIQKITLDWYDPYYATHYQVGVSQDQKNWSFAAEVTAGDGGHDEISVSTSARYVGILVVAKNTDVIGLREFKVFAPPSTEDWTYSIDAGKASVKVDTTDLADGGILIAGDVFGGEPFKEKNEVVLYRLLPDRTLKWSYTFSKSARQHYPNVELIDTKVLADQSVVVLYKTTHLGNVEYYQALLDDTGALLAEKLLQDNLMAHCISDIGDVTVIYQGLGGTYIKKVTKKGELIWGKGASSLDNAKVIMYHTDGSYLIGGTNFITGMSADGLIRERTGSAYLQDRAVDYHVNTLAPFYDNVYYFTGTGGGGDGLFVGAINLDNSQVLWLKDSFYATTPYVANGHTFQSVKAPGDSIYILMNWYSTEPFEPYTTTTYLYLYKLDKYGKTLITKELDKLHSHYHSTNQYVISGDIHLTANNNLNVVYCSEYNLWQGTDQYQYNRIHYLKFVNDSLTFKKSEMNFFEVDEYTWYPGGSFRLSTHRRAGDFHLVRSSLLKD